jgi:hypothetical protein
MDGNRAEQDKRKRQGRAKHGPLRAQQKRKRQGRTEHGPLRAQHRGAGRGRDERSTDRCARSIEELEEAGTNGARTAARRTEYEISTSPVARDGDKEDGTVNTHRCSSSDWTVSRFCTKAEMPAGTLKNSQVGI